MSEREQPPSGEPAIRVTAMPENTNPDGDIFGGWLLSQMDIAAGNVASSHSAGRAATIALEGMTFLRPVFVGDVVSVYANLVKRGRTSMQISVEAWRRHRHSQDSERVTKAVFTFVAIGSDRKPRVLPDQSGHGG